MDHSQSHHSRHILRVSTSGHRSGSRIQPLSCSLQIHSQVSSTSFTVVGRALPTRLSRLPRNAGRPQDASSACANVVAKAASVRARDRGDSQASTPKHRHPLRQWRDYRRETLLRYGICARRYPGHLRPQVNHRLLGVRQRRPDHSSPEPRYQEMHSSPYGAQSCRPLFFAIPRTEADSSARKRVCWPRPGRCRKGRRSMEAPSVMPAYTIMRSIPPAPRWRWRAIRQRFKPWIYRQAVGGHCTRTNIR